MLEHILLEFAFIDDMLLMLYTNNSVIIYNGCNGPGKFKKSKQLCHNRDGSMSFW